MIARSGLKSTSFFLLTLFFSAALSAGEKPQPLSEEKLAALLTKAPPLPVDLKLDLKTRLIDFIDCTSKDDPHGFMDQGTSSVTKGTAGTYRITAAHRHAFFSYRFRGAGKDKPVLIVIEYPDDEKRSINFSTHESGLSGRVNNDWSLETGVYCGDPLPLSGTMQYHTFIMWPQDEWPCVIVQNWSRFGSSGAASRIWVHAIEGELPVLETTYPAPEKPRRLGHQNSMGYLLASRQYFGWKSPDANKHMADYFRYIGVNQVSWIVVSNNSWNMCVDLPGWDRRDNSPYAATEDALKAFDAKGGIHFIAGFQLNGVTLNGKAVNALPADELKDTLNKAFGSFIEKYGKYKSLKGIALGAHYGIEFVDMMREKGVLKEVVAAIKAKRPDFEVITFVGGKALHKEYFNGGDGKSAWDVLSRWESSGEQWSDFLGSEAESYWQTWKRDPKGLKDAGLIVSEQYQPDDHRIFDLYSQQPRAYYYYDLDRSQARSDAVTSNYANIWNTHFEGFCGYWPGYNFWYRKSWVAPDFNGPPPQSLAAFTRIIGHRDRQVISAGSWNVRYFGWETHFRRFAKAFLSLPPADLKDVACPVDTIKVRWGSYKGKRYVSLASLIPFPGEITVDGKAVKLPPYELTTLTDSKTSAPELTAMPCAAYKTWITKKADAYEQIFNQVKQLDPAAAPAVYQKVLDQARSLLKANRLYAGDLALGDGLLAELKLRLTILQPPEINAPKLGAAPPLSGDLNAWPAEASDYKAETGEYLAGHLYFPNSWQGSKDLSTRIRFGHDGIKLYIGLEVKDDVLEAKDSCDFRLAKKTHRDWRLQNQKPDMPGWSIAVPLNKKETTGKGAGGFTYTCKRTSAGYIMEGTASLVELGLKPGDGIGFLLFIQDNDKTPNIKQRTGWARKQAFLFPHRPTFAYWSDARTCGVLRLGEAGK